MQYTRPSFSAPTSNGSISDTAYEVAVGARCPECEWLTPNGLASHICPKVTAYVGKNAFRRIPKES